MSTYFTQTQNEKSLSEELLKNRGIDFAGFVNQNGRLDNYAINSEIPLTKDKKEMYCMNIALHHKLQSDFDEDFEPVKYIIVERGNFKFLTIPVLSKILFVRMNSDLDHLELINKINSFFKRDFEGKEDN